MDLSEHRETWSEEQDFKEVARIRAPSRNDSQSADQGCGKGVNRWMSERRKSVGGLLFRSWHFSVVLKNPPASCILQMPVE